MVVYNGRGGGGTSFSWVLFHAFVLLHCCPPPPPLYKRKEKLLAFSDEEAESEMGVRELTQGHKARKQQNLALRASSTPKCRLFLWSNKEGKEWGSPEGGRYFRRSRM